MLDAETRRRIDTCRDILVGKVPDPKSQVEQITIALIYKFMDDMDREAEDLGGQRSFFAGDFAHYGWARLKAPELSGKDKLDLYADAIGRMNENPGIPALFRDIFKNAYLPYRDPETLRAFLKEIDGFTYDHSERLGDAFEYLLSVLGSQGDAGQFRTPRHIIDLMVALTAPTPQDTICDPASGTCGFLVAAGEYLRRTYPDMLRVPAQNTHFHHGMFHGYDFDNTMLRIGSMNMVLHGVEHPAIEYRDSLAEGAAGDAEAYSLILANPPFAGSLDYENTAKDLQQTVKTKKTELLFLALFLRLLKTGGRAAVIVPDGVLFGSSKAHKELRRKLVEEQKLDAVISLPGGVFKPYAGVSTAILLFTKTMSGGTDHVWFYDMQADGWSLDDKRQPLLDTSLLGLQRFVDGRNQLSESEHDKNNLPDVLTRWAQRHSSERERPRTAQSFCVPKADIEANGYDLSINRYKEVVHEVVAHRAPGEILAELRALEDEIARGMGVLEGMLK